mmetsp:Transcript_43771/g.92994  ORF Transcript_43771/g.92994 Transcript_43771/m.92994 type:complete len:210 (-) Transcript_43771:48-677(-)
MSRFDGESDDLDPLAPLDFPRYEDDHVQVVQVCASCEAGMGELDLKLIAFRHRLAEYDPKRAPVVVLRSTDFDGTILILSSGLFRVIGAKSEEHARERLAKAVKQVQRIVKDVDEAAARKARMINFKVVLVSATADLQAPVRLQAVCESLNNCDYDPEISPRLSMHFKEIPGKATVTATGRIQIFVKSDFKSVAQVLKCVREACAPFHV